MARLSINLGWRDVPLSDTLEARLGIPTVVDHNVRTFALAESRYGRHDATSIAYLYVKTGVGLGIAINGEPFYGGSGGESHFGHFQLVENGTLCFCGARGCLTTVLSEPFLEQKLRKIAPWADGELSVFERLHEESRQGNAAAVALEDEIGNHLAQALSSVVNLFTPDLVLFGGILSSAPEAFVRTVRERTRQRLFPLLRDDFRLEQTDSGDSAVVRGGAAVALETLHYA